MDISPGRLTHLGRYQIVRVLGRGAMGVVYEGLDPRLNRPVAIKILSAELDEREQGFAERFKNEAKAMGQLNHPGIVSVHDFGLAEGGLLFIGMEFVAGTDVSRMIAKQKPMVSMNRALVDVPSVVATIACVSLIWYTAASSLVSMPTSSCGGLIRNGITRINSKRSVAALSLPLLMRPCSAMHSRSSVRLSSGPTGLPVAAWMAFNTAGATTQMVGSPTPPQKS